MKERPILFSAPMVRACLDGTKTQTRRVLKQAKGLSLSVAIPDETPGVAELSWLYGDGPGYDVHEFIKRVPCPYGQPGDRLWVREAWKAHTTFDHLPPRDIPESHVWYMADDGYKAESRYRQGMFMPRWASRITLEVTGVRVERLMDISEADSIAEGVDMNEFIDMPYSPSMPHVTVTMKPRTGREAYAALWASINGAESWAANPWVWCVSFRRLEAAC